VLTDANATFRPGAIAALVRWFSIPGRQDDLTWEWITYQAPRRVLAGVNPAEEVVS
jgi:hypothetical protein